MNFFNYILCIISIFVPVWILLLSMLVAIGLRWSPFTDMTIIWWIIFVVLPLICISIQCIYFKKKILRWLLYISIPVNICIVALMIWSIIQDIQSSHNHEKMRFWSCYAESVKAFTESKGLTVMKDLDTTDVDKIIWLWINHDGDNVCSDGYMGCNLWIRTNSWLYQMSIQKIGLKKYIYNKYSPYIDAGNWFGKKNDIWLIIQNREYVNFGRDDTVWSISKTWKYIVFASMNDKGEVSEAEVIDEDIIPNYEYIIRVYITSGWLIPVQVGSSGNELKCYKLYTR